MPGIITGLWNLITSCFSFLAILFFDYLMYLTFTTLSQIETGQQACFKAPYPKILEPSLFPCLTTKHMPSHGLQNRLHWNTARNRSNQVPSIPTRKSRNSSNIWMPETRVHIGKERIIQWTQFFLHSHRLFNTQTWYYCGKAAVQLDGGCYNSLVMSLDPKNFIAKDRQGTWLSSSTRIKNKNVY